MSEARAIPRASGPSVPPVADAAEEHPLQRLRRELGMTGRAFAKLAGCSPMMISNMERGLAVPSVELARRIAALNGGDIAKLGFGQPHRCQCKPDCPELTFATYAQRHFAPGPASWERCLAELDQLKRERRLLTTREHADRLGCRYQTVSGWILEGLLPAIRYPGAWPIEKTRPYLLPKDSLETGRHLLVESGNRAREGIRRAWRDDRYADRPQKPRHPDGEDRACPDCGRIRYYPPSHQTESGLCATCEKTDRTRTGRGLGAIREIARATRRAWILHSGRADGRHAKGRAFALEVGERALECVRERPGLLTTRDGRRALIESLIREFCDPAALDAGSRRDPKYRNERKRIERALKRAHHELHSGELTRLLG